MPLPFILGGPGGLGELGRTKIELLTAIAAAIAEEETKSRSKEISAERLKELGEKKERKEKLTKVLAIMEEVLKKAQQEGNNEVIEETTKIIQQLHQAQDKDVALNNEVLKEIEKAGKALL